MFSLGIVLGLFSCSTDLPDGFYADGPTGVEVTVERLDHAPSTARLADPFEPAGPNYLYSVDNDNQRYGLQVRHAQVFGESWAYLRLGDHTWKASTVGNSQGGAVVGFDLDRTAADASAALLSVPRRDREPLDAGVVGTFHAAPAPIGGPAPITLRVAKLGGPPVSLVTGGAAGGVRDERFSFEVRRDGVLLPTRKALGFGSARAARRLADGDVAEVTTDLALWVDLDAPGVYSVKCLYDGGLEPEGGVRGPENLHLRWDLVLTGEISLVVGG
ncbi:MAG: hypothetical protein JRI25_09905 [Deltaproteobacteria bacterium]|nr:hypothetical protein [Deltaproteobacteria bacterium]